MHSPCSGVSWARVSRRRYVRWTAKHFRTGFVLDPRRGRCVCLGTGNGTDAVSRRDSQCRQGSLIRLPPRCDLFWLAARKTVDGDAKARVKRDGFSESRAPLYRGRTACLQICRTRQRKPGRDGSRGRLGRMRRHGTHNGDDSNSRPAGELSGLKGIKSRYSESQLDSLATRPSQWTERCRTSTP